MPHSSHADPVGAITEQEARHVLASVEVPGLEFTPSDSVKIAENDEQMQQQQQQQQPDAALNVADLPEPWKFVGIKLAPVEFEKVTSPQRALGQANARRV